MNRQRADRILSTTIFGVVCLILAFGPLMMGATRGEDIAVIGLLTSFAAGLWLLRVWLNPQPNLPWPPLCFAILAFVVYALFRYPYATVEYAARTEVLRILIYALLFLIVLNNTSHRSLTIVTRLIIALGVFMSFYAIYQFMTRSDMVWNLTRPAQYAGRGSGTYICPNHLAGYLEMAIPLGLASLFMGRLSHTGRMILGYATLAMLAGLAATVSRGGWFSAGIGLMAFFSVLVFKGNRRIPAIAMAAIMLVTAIGFVSTTTLAKRRLQEATAKTDGSDSRTHIWKAAGQLWKSQPWVGIGPGQFDRQFRLHRPPQLQARAVYVHNDYLNTLADWGIVGFLIIGGFFAGFFPAALRIWRHVQRDTDALASQSSNRTAFVLATLIGTVSLLVHSFIDFNFQIPANAILLLSLIAMVCAIGHASRLVPTLTVHPIGRWTLTLIVVLACGWIVPESILKYREGTRRTYSLYTDLPASEEMRLLREMSELEPLNPETAYRLGEGLRLLNWEKTPGYYGKIQEAIEYFKQAIRLDPNDAYAHVRLGMCLDLLRDYDAATESFLTANRIDPNGAFTAGYLGWHYLQIDDYEQAREHLRRSLSLNWWDNVLAEEQLEIVAMFLPEEPKKTTETKPAE